MAPRAEPREICPWCGQPLRPVVVHGEIRCGRCHMPVVLCCEGAPLREQEVPACPLPPAPAAAAGTASDRQEGAARTSQATARRAPSRRQRQRGETRRRR